MAVTDQDCDDYLGETSWSLEEIGGALAAEAAAQLRVCDAPDLEADPAADTADFDEALMRRVAVNLARRRFLSNVELGDEALLPPQPGRDPEVRRLEAPFRKLVFG